MPVTPGLCPESASRTPEAGHRGPATSQFYSEDARDGAVRERTRPGAVFHKDTRRLKFHARTQQGQIVRGQRHDCPTRTHTHTHTHGHTRTHTHTHTHTHTAGCDVGVGRTYAHLQTHHSTLEKVSHTYTHTHFCCLNHYILHFSHSIVFKMHSPRPPQLSPPRPSKIRDPPPPPNPANVNAVFDSTENAQNGRAP